jgi:FkbM family methyltransferase
MLSKQLLAVGRSHAFRSSLRKLRLHKVINFVIGGLPWYGSFKNLNFRRTSTEAVSLALEMFNGNCYDLSDVKSVNTILDLGCNVGFFPLLVAEKFGKNFKGLAVDANAALITEAAWHAVDNNLNVKCIHAKVGCTPEFWLCEANTCSTGTYCKEHDENAGMFTRQTVPFIGDFEAWWLAEMGDVRCSLLKMDIEGAEFWFIESQQPFLLRVDVAIVEWHKYTGSFGTLHDRMFRAGFNFCKVQSNEGLNGTAIFTRSCTS